VESKMLEWQHLSCMCCHLVNKVYTKKLQLVPPWENWCNTLHFQFRQKQSECEWLQHTVYTQTCLLSASTPLDETWASEESHYIFWRDSLIQEWQPRAATATLLRGSVVSCVTAPGLICILHWGILLMMIFC